MNKAMLKVAMLVAVTGFGVAACGGGKTAANNAGFQSPTASAKVVSGVITGFGPASTAAAPGIRAAGAGVGSVIVNGISYDVSGAPVTVEEDNTATADDLEVGMVVTIEGDVLYNSGTATSISYGHEVNGAVLANSIVAPATTGTINVMGQDVTITAATVFSSVDANIASVSDITAGNLVEVSGFPGDTANSIFASRIEVKAADWQTAGEDLDVKGTATNVTATSFTLNGVLTVDYSGANVDADVPADFTDMFVKVAATTLPVANGTTPETYTLTATRVKLAGNNGHRELSHGRQNGEDLEIQGVITAIGTNGSSVTVNGQTIYASANDVPATPAAASALSRSAAREDDGHEDHEGGDDDGDDDHDNDGYDDDGYGCSSNCGGNNSGSSVSFAGYTVGQTIRVEAQVVNANGDLVATAIRGDHTSHEQQFGDDDGVGTAGSNDMWFELSGGLDAVTPATATTTSTITLFGQDITVTRGTMMIDESGAQSYLTFDDLAADDCVEVDVARDAANALVAIKLKRQATCAEEKIQGIVSLVTPTLAIENIAVVDGSAVPAALTEGARVEAIGSWDGATFNATQIQLEN